jgi:hypothetical protein
VHGGRADANLTDRLNLSSSAERNPLGAHRHQSTLGYRPEAIRNRLAFVNLAHNDT